MDRTRSLRGVNAPVYEIAALTRGQTVAEIVEDYSGLTPARVEAAVEYAKVYPKAGRPLPARSFKRILSDMARAPLARMVDDVIAGIGQRPTGVTVTRSAMG